MRDSSRRPNSVTALRSRSRRNPRTRRLIRGTLLIIALISSVATAIITDRHIRGWAAAVAVMSFVAAAVAWLAGASRTLSDSDGDPQDFQLPTETP